MAAPDIPIEDMDFKQLRAKVQEQEDTIARLKRTFEDTMQNIDFDNFSGSFRKEAENFRSEFTMTEREIKLSVSALGEEMSELSLQADKIYSRVTKTITTSFALDEMPTEENTSALEKTMICEYNGNRYYYNDLFGAWEEYPDYGVQTYFEQNADGFYYLGGVKVDGSLIVSDSITADKINATNLHAERMYNTASTNFYASVNSMWGDFGIFSGSVLEEPKTVRDSSCVWGVYQSDLETNVINMYASGNNYFGYNVPNQIAYPKGKWSFGSCTVVDWGDNRPVAVFS